MNTFGFIRDRNSNKGSLYFADPRTRKKVYFYDEEGHLTNTVRLPKLMPDDDHISIIVARSRDTIIATSAHDNYMYVFGKAGTYSVANFNPLVANSYPYYILGPNRADLGRDMAYSEVRLYSPLIRFPDTVRDQLQYIYRIYYRSPLIARITGLTTGKPKAELMMQGFLTRIIPNSVVGGFHRRFAYSANSIYCTFPESDTLYRFSSSGQLEQQTPIRSQYADIRPHRLAFGNDIQAYADELWQDKSIVHFMDYDAYRKLLYLRCYHAAAAGAKPIEKGDHRKWAMLVYDEHLNKVGEMDFEADTYNPMSLMATPNGLLFEKINLNRDETNRKEFQLFEVDYRP